MPEERDLTLLHEQQKSKPDIEDVIPYYLTGDNKQILLNFIEYLRMNKMNPIWAGVHNSWKTTYRGKCLFYIRLCNESPFGEIKKWVINPYLLNIDKYEEAVIKEGLHNFIWNSIYYCKFCRTPCHGHPPGRDIKLLGKEIKSICRGRQPVWFYEPDETTINCVKRLLELEREARKG